MPTRPVLSLVVIAQPDLEPPTPALIVNLNDPDRERGEATLAAIEAVDIPRRRWQDSEPVPNAPTGWSHLLWPSQILI